MKVTNRAVLEAANALQQMSQEVLKNESLLRFRISMAINQLRPIADELNAQKAQLMREHAKEDGNGEPLMYATDNGMEYALRDPEEQRKEWRAVMDAEVDVPDFKQVTPESFGKTFPWRAWWDFALINVGFLTTPDDGEE